MDRLRAVGNVRRAPYRRRRWRLTPSNFIPFLLLVSLYVAVEIWPWLETELSLPDLPTATQNEASDAAYTYSFRPCGRPPHQTCVIDGDTFHLRGESIRIADIDAPETHPPRCSHEAMLGAEATDRLRALLSAGPFEMRRVGSRDEDRYGRKLRTVLRDGRSLRDTLVAEGLAREWGGRREPWCS